MTGKGDGPARWSDALLAAAVAARDPARFGGVVLRAAAGPVRDRWLDIFRGLQPAGLPWRRLPVQVSDDRLLGGLDLAATLRTGRRVAERGLLAAANGGVLVVPQAERLDSLVAARIAACLDHGMVAVERDGLSFDSPARFGAILLDEGAASDERAPSALYERMAFWIDLDGISWRDAAASAPPDGFPVSDRMALPLDALEAFCAASAALGIRSPRAPLLALKVARSLAGQIDPVACAAGLVLGPRAQALPAAAEAEPQTDSRTEEEPQSEHGNSGAPLADVVLAAARAAIPPGLLADLQGAAAAERQAGAAGRAGVESRPARHGRPMASRRGSLRGGVRLDLIATLRAAAPWQPVRRSAEEGSRVVIRPDDFQVRRFKRAAQTTVVFAVDASGSSALHRLSEAKGAVELLLADCYVRRDEVALISFRGEAAELVLSPTRSLARAKRGLGGLPGGGGTPLAAALDATAELAVRIRRKGSTPLVVLLTDARANIARNGNHGRPEAQEDARVSARNLRAADVSTLLVDTAPQPHPFARELSDIMGATYLALPHADANRLSAAVRNHL